MAHWGCSTDHNAWFRNLWDVRVTRTARKHGIDPDTIRRVLAAPLRTVEQGDHVLYIGLTPSRDLLEIVVAPGEPDTVIHAMRLRPANYGHLSPGRPP